jgi:hypothetical protein
MHKLKFKAKSKIREVRAEFSNNSLSNDKLGYVVTNKTIDIYFKQITHVWIVL